MTSLFANGIRMPPEYDPAMYELAIYEEIDGEPGCYELHWLSEATATGGN